MITDIDELFADRSTPPPSTAVPVEDPAFTVRVGDADIPSLKELADLIDPEELEPQELLMRYTNLLAEADRYMLASKELRKAAEMLNPYVTEIINARNGMEIPAYVGVTPYRIAVESTTALKLEGDKDEIAQALRLSGIPRLIATVDDGPKYHTASVLKAFRDTLKEDGIDPKGYTPELVAQSLPPEIGKFVTVDNKTRIIFKEQ